MMKKGTRDERQDYSKKILKELCLDAHMSLVTGLILNSLSSLLPSLSFRLLFLVSRLAYFLRLIKGPCGARGRKTGSIALACAFEKDEVELKI